MKKEFMFDLVIIFIMYLYNKFIGLFCSVSLLRKKDICIFVNVEFYVYYI